MDDDSDFSYNLSWAWTPSPASSSHEEVVVEEDVQDESPELYAIRKRYPLFVESESSEESDDSFFNEKWPNDKNEVSVTECSSNVEMGGISCLGQTSLLDVENDEIVSNIERDNERDHQRQSPCSPVDVSQHIRQPLFISSGHEDSGKSNYKEEVIVISDEEEAETENFKCARLVTLSDDEGEASIDNQQTQGKSLTESNRRADVESLDFLVDLENDEAASDYTEIDSSGSQRIPLPSFCINKISPNSHVDESIIDLISLTDSLSIRTESGINDDSQFGEECAIKPFLVQTPETELSCEIFSDTQIQKQSSCSPVLQHKQPLFVCSDQEDSDSSPTNIYPTRQGPRPHIIMSDEEDENEDFSCVGLALDSDDEDLPVAESASSPPLCQIQFPGLRTPSHLSFKTPISALQSESCRKYTQHRDDLTRDLQLTFNKTVFNNQLPDFEITWNKRLTNTAGKTISLRASDGRRMAKIELSCKVCDRYDRLRDTLIHEMCHAATWLIDGNRRDQHGPCWQSWTDKAMRAHPELPKIRRCHSYQIHKKFIYKIGRHSKSIKISTAKCPYCGSSIELMPNLRQDGTPAPPRTANKWIQFVNEHKDQVRADNPGMSQTAVLQHLSAQYRALKELN
ncbi:germ cell nuclear acidic protein-like isoform X2 [Corticium candelabrum]|uniref:germ cell nuclear acidic protein-like isoform X2 n=1 Tax=Corticium candelabrum TaxID=121492 RepID=UPI002E25C5AC|nr:germ cell nuclear acidic protein-like isoform X2 [Corticium candelabrum]